MAPSVEWVTVYTSPVPIYPIWLYTGLALYKNILSPAIHRAGPVYSGPVYSRWKYIWDTCRFRVPIGNNGAMHFNGYPEAYNHAHSLHVYFWYNLGTIYSSAYPELYKHDHSLLVYFSHNLGTIHTMWVFLDWMLSRSTDRYATWTRDSAIHDVIVFNFFFWVGGKPPPQTPHPVNNFDIQMIKSTYLFYSVHVKRK